MAVKYSVQYRDNFNQKCRVDISNENYNGDPVILRGVAGKACIIERDCSDDPYDTIINSKASVSFWQTEDLPVDILELQLAEDREFTVKLYIENALKFSGFMVADGIVQIFQSAPFEVNITAADGLYLLDGIPYTHDDLDGGRCVINYLRRILFSNDNLGNPLPIQWCNTLKNDEFPLEDDVFSGSVEWSPFGEGFSELKDGSYIYKDCRYIIEGLLKSMQCRIVQDNGYWNVLRINDIVTGQYTIKEIGATQEGFDITSRDVDVIRQIKGVQENTDYLEYSFINENALLTVLPALKLVSTTYDQNERENILPNGNMDMEASFNNIPFWTLTGDTEFSFLEPIPSIYDDRGMAVKVVSSKASGKYFEMIKPLPIDSDVLYSTINIGFKFSPIAGFPVDEDGYIIWDANVFSYLVSFYDNDGEIWYLNEFGFWTKDFVALIPITVDKLKLNDVAQIDFNKFQNVPLIIPKSLPIGRTNEPGIKISFFIPTICVIDFDDIYIKVNDEKDKYDATFVNNKNTAKEEYTLNISSSHNGFYVSSYMTEFGESGKQKFFSDEKTASVTLTNMNSQAIMRNRYKPSLMFEGSIYAKKYTYCEIYNIKTLDDKNFIPLKSNWNTETNTIGLTCAEVRDDEISLLITQNGVNYGGQ